MNQASQLHTNGSLYASTSSLSPSNEAEAAIALLTLSPNLPHQNRNSPSTSFFNSYNRQSPPPPPQPRSPSPPAGPQSISVPKSAPQPRKRKRTSNTNSAESPSTPAPTVRDTGVIRCICGFSEDDGSSIFCDACGFWQHISCVIPRTPSPSREFASPSSNSNSDTEAPELNGSVSRRKGKEKETELRLPEKWFCEHCVPRPVDRDRAREIQMRWREKENREGKRRRAGSNANGTMLQALNESSHMSVVDARKVTAEYGDGAGPSALTPQAIKRRPGKPRPRKAQSLIMPLSQLQQLATLSAGSSTPNSFSLPLPMSPAEESMLLEPWAPEYVLVEDDRWTSSGLENFRTWRRTWPDEDICNYHQSDEEVNDDLGSFLSGPKSKSSRSVSPFSGNQSRSSRSPFAAPPSKARSTNTVSFATPSCTPVILAPNSTLTGLKTQIKLVPPINNGSDSYNSPPIYALYMSSAISPPVPPSTYLLPYVSHVHSLRQYGNSPLSQYALLGLPKPFVRLIPESLGLALDARECGGVARWARNGCWPNAVIRPIMLENQRVDGGVSFGIFSLREIKKGEEIVLGWQWDKGSAVHRLKRVLENGCRDAEEETYLRHSFDRILCTVKGTFPPCACGPTNKSRCVFAQMQEFNSSNRRHMQQQMSTNSRRKAPTVVDLGPTIAWEGSDTGASDEMDIEASGDETTGVKVTVSPPTPHKPTDLKKAAIPQAPTPSPTPSPPKTEIEEERIPPRFRRKRCDTLKARASSVVTPPDPVLDATLMPPPPLPASLDPTTVTSLSTLPTDDTPSPRMPHSPISPPDKPLPLPASPLPSRTPPPDSPVAVASPVAASPHPQLVSLPDSQAEAQSFQALALSSPLSNVPSLPSPPAPAPIPLVGPPPTVRTDFKDWKERKKREKEEMERQRREREEQQRAQLPEQRATSSQADQQESTNEPMQLDGTIDADARPRTASTESPARDEVLPAIASSDSVHEMDVDPPALATSDTTTPQALTEPGRLPSSSIDISAILAAVAGPLLNLGRTVVDPPNQASTIQGPVGSSVPASFSGSAFPSPDQTGSLISVQPHQPDIHATPIQLHITDALTAAEPNGRLTHPVDFSSRRDDYQTAYSPSTSRSFSMPPSEYIHIPLSPSPSQYPKYQYERSPSVASASYFASEPPAEEDGEIRGEPGGPRAPATAMPANSPIDVKPRISPERGDGSSPLLPRYPTQPRIFQPSPQHSHAASPSPRRPFNHPLPNLPHARQPPPSQPRSWRGGPPSLVSRGSPGPSTWDRDRDRGERDRYRDRDFERDRDRDSRDRDRDFRDREWRGGMTPRDRDRDRFRDRDRERDRDRDRDGGWRGRGRGW